MPNILRKNPLRRRQDFRARGYPRITMDLYYLIEFMIDLIVPERVFFILWICEFREFATLALGAHRDINDVLEDVEAKIRSLAPNNPRRNTLENVYDVQCDNFLLCAGIENRNKKSFEIFIPLNFELYKARMKDMRAYKNPVRPARMPVARRSIGERRRSRRSSLSNRNSLQVSSAGPSGQAMINRARPHPEWDTIMETKLVELAEKLQPANSAPRKRFKFERDAPKNRNANLIHYRVPCFVNNCDYVGTGKVGFLPGKSRVNPQCRIDNITTHFFLQHPHQAKNYHD